MVSEKELLNKFGRILMEEVRDSSIERYQLIMSGHLKSAVAKSLNQKIKKLDGAQISIVKELVASVVDTTVHNMLWMIEQNEHDIDVVFRKQDGPQEVSLRMCSDGLTGELYTEDGWIAQFSQYADLSPNDLV